jgi:hypothetical protein
VTHPPDDDRKLMQFLKQHQPIPPPAAPGLERQVMAALPVRRQKVWLVIPAIAAGIAMAVWGYRLSQPAPVAEAPDLEEFIEASWAETIPDSTQTPPEPSTEFWALVESHSNN